jgi:RNA polymerase sigma factor (TIGR02999 family)
VPHDEESPSSVTELLAAWRHGDREAFDRVIELVHRELHRIARAHMRHERSDHSLQPTALVNEAYARLVDINRIDWRDRAHFLALAAQTMRRILVDYSRRRGNQKRGAGRPHVVFSEHLEIFKEVPADVVALNDALEALAVVDKRKSRVVELRCFGGLSVQETAAILGVSSDTVQRDWRLAKAWIRRELTRN